MNAFNAFLFAALFALATLCADAQPTATAHPEFHANFNATQPDGKVVVVGSTANDEGFGYGAFGIERLNADGTVDTSFGNGFVRVEIWGYAEYANALAILPDGSMIVGGNAVDPALVTNGNPGCYYLFCGYFPALVKLRPDGSIDRSFNGSGKVILRIDGYSGWEDVPDSASLRSIALQPDGRLVLRMDDGVDVVRLNPDGSIDHSYITHHTAETINKATAPDRGSLQGLWWGGPSEAGWNLNVSHQDDALFVLWATYDETGKATWLSMSAFQSEPGTFSGTLYKTSVPAFTQPPYDVSRLALTDVGTATLVFDNQANGLFPKGSFTYRLGGVERTKTIVRYGPGPRVPYCRWSPGSTVPLNVNYTDIWYADPPGSEPGWAVAVSDVGNAFAFTWFTYDVGGSPTWFYGEAFEVYGDYDSGSIELEIADNDRLLMHAGGPNTPEWTRTLTRYVYRNGATSCAY